MSTVKEKKDIKGYLADLFQNNRDLIDSGSSPPLNRHREKALSLFRKLGLPSRKSENYRYAPLGDLFEKEFAHSFNVKKVSFNIHDIFKCDIPDLDTNLILLVNGKYYNSENPLREIDGGIVVGSMAKAATEMPEIFEKYYNSMAGDTGDGLVAMNTAFAQDGVFIYIPKGSVLKKPLQVVNIMIHETDLMAQHRNLIIAEENSSARVVVCDHTLSANSFLSNNVTEIFAAPRAYFSMCKIQNEHNGSAQVSHTFVKQQRESNVFTNTISLHGGFIRNNVFARLDDEGCENHTLGLYLTDKKQYIDNYVKIDHAQPGCHSNQLFKGVLDDQASGSFNGIILVRENAQKTNAYQANNNILLTDDARINSRPQLEIYADDVKCSHGSTVGQLDQNALFYMRSRGIPEREARLLLMYAFAYEVIGRIDVKPLRNRIDDLVNKRLRGELSRCNNCVMSCG